MEKGYLLMFLYRRDLGYSAGPDILESIQWVGTSTLSTRVRIYIDNLA
jgi:hypothetical protein